MRQGLLTAAVLACTAGASCVVQVAPASGNPVTADVPETLRASLDRATRQAVSDPALRGATAGVVLIDLESHGLLTEHRGEAPMSPASNMKVLTTAAALEVLGPGFTFATTLSLLPPPPSTHRADHAHSPPSLLLTGTGDPAFGDATLLAQRGLDPDLMLDQWVAAVEATGQRVFGKLYVDDAIFDRVFTHPEWPADQFHRHWSAPVAGLSFNGNCLTVHARPGATAAARANLSVYPLFSGIEVVNKTRSGPGQTFWGTRARESNRFTFLGEVKHKGAPVRVPVHDPPVLLAAYLREKLAGRGIQVGDIERVRPDAAWPPPVEAGRLDRVPAEAQPLHRVRTSLLSVLDRTNQASTNHYAEALLKHLGWRATGAAGSFQSGGSAVLAFLQEILGDTSEVSAVTVVDGSGLSRGNRVSAEVLARTLAHATADPERADAFLGTLSTGGVNGTLRRRFKDLPDQVVVRGKSGYIRSVSTLSGVLELAAAEPAAPPRRYAFAILFNGTSGKVSNRTLKQVQDRLVRTWARHLMDHHRNAERSAEVPSGAGTRQAASRIATISAP